MGNQEENPDGQPQKGNHGGPRPGAGRPPIPVRTERVNPAKDLKARRTVLRKWPELVDAMIGNALNGDGATQRYLMDRIWGRIADGAKPLAAIASEEDWGDVLEGQVDEAKEMLQELLVSGWTAETQRKLGLEGLWRLWLRARRGCRESAKDLAQMWLGQPALPVNVRAQAMTSPDEVKQELVRIYLAQGLSEEVALARIEELEPEETNG